jgi:hypothetical protein
MGGLSLTRGLVFRLQFLLVSSAQSFLGPSPVGLATIFYCLKFETSLFVASYDSQGYGGGIRPRLHTRSVISIIFKLWALCVTLLLVYHFSCLITMNLDLCSLEFYYSYNC